MLFEQRALGHRQHSGPRQIAPLIEAMINQELGEPFRRDAMKKPVEVAGIDPNDMRPQPGA